MLCIKIFLSPIFITPNRTNNLRLAQLVERSTVAVSKYRTVNGSIPLAEIVYYYFYYNCSIVKILFKFPFKTISIISFFITTKTNS